MIVSIVIYMPTSQKGFEVEESTDTKVTVSKITAFMGKVTIFFSDGYKIIYKGLPYSVEVVNKRNKNGA